MIRRTRCAPPWRPGRRRSMTRGPWASALRRVGAVLVCILVAACTPPPVRQADDPEPTAPLRQTGDPEPTTPLGRPGDPEPTTLTWPDPPASRPVVDLRFAVSDDLTSVDGTERIVFTPDLDICELVFRLWPNKPFAAVYGNALRVTDVTVEGRAVEPTIVPAGAPDGVPGTLLEVPLPSCRAAGSPVTAELDFTLTLGEGADERVGVATAGDTAWFGTAFPLLAWERGRGWAREPAEAIAGEFATSETFRLRSLEVTAPSRYEVLGTGARDEVDDQPDGDTTVHRFTAPALRDVTVTVGRLEVVHTALDGSRLHVGVPSSGSQGSARQWAMQVRQSIREVADRLGPMPYDDVWVSVLADQTEGIEFPGAIQFGDVSPDEQDWLVTHEVAHLWFYGLVGNNQARDPWLDEALATFVQLLVDADDPGIRYADGEVGHPMSHWAALPRPSRAYVRHVYRMGGAAMLDARTQAGADAFDAALIEYLRDNAHSIAVPSDVEAALTDLPEAVRVLRRAEALPAAGS